MNSFGFRSWLPPPPNVLVFKPTRWMILFVMQIGSQNATNAMSVVPFMRIKATEDEEAGDNIFLLSLSLLESVRAVQCTVYSADLYSW